MVLVPIKEISGTVKLPGSKSLSNRILLLAALAQDRIVNRHKFEYSGLRKEREDHISKIIASKKRDKEIKRKLLFYLKIKEERLTKLLDEEEAQKSCNNFCCCRMHAGGRPFYVVVRGGG